MKHVESLPLTIREYREMFIQYSESKGSVIDWHEVERRLQAESEWTLDGATRVAELARHYGAFVLRNALALAIALNVEDGELGL